MGKLVLGGIETGGTKTCCAVCHGGASPIYSPAFPTSSNPVQSLEGPLQWLAQQFALIGLPHAVGIASFGPVGRDAATADYGLIGRTPKPGWLGFDLLGAVHQAYPHARICIDSDVNAAALAEARTGAARGASACAYVTCGTGIGVGVVHEGTLRRAGPHLEAGHMRIPRLGGDAFPGICTFHGDCWEGLCSGPALAARAGSNPAGMPPDWDGWYIFARYTAVALANLVYAIAPERIVLGGGVMSAGRLGGDALLGSVRVALREALAGYAVPAGFTAAPDKYLVAPANGDRAGALGALLLAREALSASVFATAPPRTHADSPLDPGGNMPNPAPNLVYQAQLPTTYDVIIVAHADQSGGVAMACQLYVKFVDVVRRFRSLTIALAIPDTVSAKKFAGLQVATLRQQNLQPPELIPVPVGPMIVKADSGNVDPQQTLADLCNRFGDENLRELHDQRFAQALLPHIKKGETLIVSCGDSTAVNFARLNDLKVVYLTDIVLPDAIHQVLTYGACLTRQASTALAHFAAYDRMADEVFLMPEEFCGRQYPAYFGLSATQVMHMPGLLFGPGPDHSVDSTRKGPLKELCEKLMVDEKLVFAFGGGGQVWMRLYQQMEQAYLACEPRPPFSLLLPEVCADVKDSSRLVRVANGDGVYQFRLHRPHSAPCTLADPGVLTYWYARSNVVVGRGGLVAQQVLSLMMADDRPPVLPWLLFCEEAGHPQIEHERLALLGMGFVKGCTLDQLRGAPLEVIKRTMRHITEKDSKELRMRVRARYAFHGVERAIEAIIHKYML